MLELLRENGQKPEAGFFSVVGQGELTLVSFLLCVKLISVCLRNSPAARRVY